MAGSGREYLAAGKLKIYSTVKLSSATDAYLDEVGDGGGRLHHYSDIFFRPRMWRSDPSSPCSDRKLVGHSSKNLSASDIEHLFCTQIRREINYFVIIFYGSLSLFK